MHFSDAEAGIQQNGSKISELPDGTAVARVCAAIVAQFGAQSLGKSSESFWKILRWVEC